MSIKPMSFMAHVSNNQVNVDDEAETQKQAINQGHAIQNDNLLALLHNDKRKGSYDPYPDKVIVAEDGVYAQFGTSDPNTLTPPVKIGEITETQSSYAGVKLERYIDINNNAIPDTIIGIVKQQTKEAISKWSAVFFVDIAEKYNATLKRVLSSPPNEVKTDPKRREKIYVYNHDINADGTPDTLRHLHDTLSNQSLDYVEAYLNLEPDDQGSVTPAQLNSDNTASLEH